MADDGPDTVSDYFQYYPSLALCLVALILFFGITVVISIENWVKKSKFMWIITFTGSLEVAGYVCHLIGQETVNLTAYICFLVFTILAPNFLALANYIAVGKIAEQLALSGRFLNTKSIAIGFFVIDLICIGVQGGGSAVISSTLQSEGKASQPGETTVLIGLAIQLFFFASFTFVTFHVWRLSRKSQVAIAPQAFICLFSTIALITMRNIYRVIEIAVGWAGKFNTHEKYFYCLDALPIFLAFVIYAVLHLDRYIKAPLAPLRSGTAAGDKQPQGTLSVSAYDQASSIV